LTSFDAAKVSEQLMNNPIDWKIINCYVFYLQKFFCWFQVIFFL